MCVCAVSQEFAKIALDRIVKSEAGTRGFAKAARVLQVSIEEVEQAVAALTTLFARAVRLHLQHAELLSLFSDIGDTTNRENIFKNRCSNLGL